MSTTVAGLFTDSKKAGEAVAELKQAGFAEDISIVAKDEETGEVSTEQVKQDATDGALAGATTGAIAGFFTGILASLVSIALPGVGPVLVAGPLAATWGLTGGALGALAGGLVGALVDLGFSEDRAKAYEDAIMRGEVLVAVRTDDENIDDVLAVYDSYDVTGIETVREV